MAKGKNNVNEFLLAADVAHVKRLELYAAQLDKVYNTAVNEFVAMGVNGKIASKIKPGAVFSFNDFPKTKIEAQNILAKFQKGMLETIAGGMKSEWLQAVLKNTGFTKMALPNGVDTSKYSARNMEALAAFQQRKSNGLSLSDRVWKYSNQFKNEIEMSLDVGLGEGKSAAQLSRDVRAYLKEPDKLFHKVKNKHGQLKLSKAAQAYHPGQGVYRSSYKNAMRLTRTEINMAYRESDALKWKELDFVVGYEVRLSNNHKVYDICDVLAGKYPKDFRFVGWHPHCRCHAIPILNTEQEFLDDQAALLKGEAQKSLQSSQMVADVPAGFKQWVKENKQRAAGWASQPYFIKDNFKGGKLSGGLKVDTSKLAKEKAAKELAIKQAKEAADKAAQEAFEKAQAAAKKAAEEAAAKLAAEIAAKEAAEKAAAEAFALKQAKAAKYAQKAIDNADALGITGKEYDSLKKMLANPNFNPNTVSNKMSDLNKVIKNYQPPAASGSITPASLKGKYTDDEIDKLFKAFDAHKAKYTGDEVKYLEYINKELYWAKEKLGKYPTSGVMVELLEQEAKLIKVKADAAEAALVKEAEEALKKAKSSIKNNGYTYTEKYTPAETKELARLNAVLEDEMIKSGLDYTHYKVQAAQHELSEYTIKLGEKYHKKQVKLKPLYGKTDADGAQALKEYIEAPGITGWASSGQVGGVYKGELEYQSALAYAKKTGIPYKEMSLISRYFRGSGFINNYLIGKDTNGLKGLLDKYRTAANHVIEKMPRYRGTSYRGVGISGDSDRQVTGILEAFKTGKPYEYESFISTSRKLKIAHDFAAGRGNNEMIFKIHGKNGVNGKPISHYASEDEIVMRAGTKFRIISVRKVTSRDKSWVRRAGNWEVEMEEIDD